MGFLDSISGLGTSIVQGAKNVGDFVGLDGSFGYDGAWSSAPSLSQMNIPGASAVAGGYDTASGFAPQSVSGASSLGGMLQGGLDWLGQNKNTINSLAGLGSMYGAYTTAQNQQDYANQMLDMQRRQMATQEAERQRQLDKEEEAQQGLAMGFQNAGFR